MSTTTLTLTPVTVVASGVNAAGATTRGTADMRGGLGGLLTLKITNGATGPTVQCEGRVLISHSSGATPAASSAGADWKTLWIFGGGIVANAVTEQSLDVPPCQHLEVEFTGNTGQGVTVEAELTKYTNAATTV